MNLTLSENVMTHFGEKHITMTVGPVKLECTWHTGDVCVSAYVSETQIGYKQFEDFNCDLNTLREFATEIMIKAINAGKLTVQAVK